MEGMILAAGAGTRLGSLTDEVPKALVPVAGKPLLGWVAEHMAASGVTRIIVNTHHHDEQIRAFLGQVSMDGVEFALSPEPGGPYETGGGLLHAAPLFREKEPFLLHNADVLSTIRLDSLVARHREGIETGEGRVETGAGRPEAKRDGPDTGGGRLLASLAVQHRDSKRTLLFDDRGLLGWENRGSDRARDGRVQVRDPQGEIRGLSFTGIHVIDPVIFGLTHRTGAFSIITLYLELAAAGWIIQPLDVSGEEWFDIGTPERLEEARSRFG
jgi:NDP-sugar pyrophosphorylase family protein